MKVLLTLPCDDARLMPAEAVQRLERIAEVVLNPHPRPLTPLELGVLIHDCDVCMTGWTTPVIGGAVLDAAHKLQLVAHVGGTVAPVVTADVFRRGVRVCSANRVLARYVAEGILAYMLAALREIPFFDRELHAGVAWPRDVSRPNSLYDQRIGFVGLGTTGRCLLDLLRPFEVPVTIYDPYVGEDVITDWPFARLAALDEVLAGSTVVSIHASLTPETAGLLDGARLKRLPDGALLVNTARGPIVDEAALTTELASGRIRACLDVFTEEPLPLNNPLRSLPNVVLGPHLAGAPSHGWLAETMVAEIERWIAGRPLEHEISFEQFSRMTRPVSTSSRSR